jgi:hypothetical protein
MRRVTSFSVSASLEEINASIVDGASDLILHLRWYLIASHKWKRLNSAPVRFLVSLLYDLKNYAIVGSVLPVQKFLIINLIE